MIADNEVIDWLQLINCENVGPVTFFKLLETYGSAAAALASLPAKYKKFPSLCRRKRV